MKNERVAPFATILLCIFVAFWFIRSAIYTIREDRVKTGRYSSRPVASAEEKGEIVLKNAIFATLVIAGGVWYIRWLRSD